MKKQNLPDAIPAAGSAPLARILVVDDDRFICTLHTAVLERKGYEVVTAGSGEDALIEVACGHFDLVLTDRTMPGLDGASMVLALRGAGSRVPVVMVSGSLALSPLPPAVAREIAVALVKPAKVADVLAAVALALQCSNVSQCREPGGLSAYEGPSAPVPSSLAD